MRIKVVHETRYRYEAPVRGVIQVLRLTPRDHDGQHVLRWRLEPSLEGRLAPGTDHFGNLTHTFSCDGALSELTISASGEAETTDTAGLVGETVERLPEALYLRETDLTAPDAAIRDFAEGAVGGSREPLDRLHALLAAIHGTISFDTTRTDSHTRAAEAFGLGRGACQDLTHIFVACARHLGIPARYVSGYFVRADGVVDQEAGHAWAEARVPGLGWVGFDPANGICTTDAHLRVAIGLDYLGAAPVRGSRRGGGQETMRVRLRVEPVGQRGQAQSQSQSQS